MNIALIGASGFIGSAIRKEALSRGHQITALVTNPAKLQSETNLRVQKSDVMDTDHLAQALARHDLVISAFSGHANSDVYGYYMRGIRSIIEAVRKAAIPRLLVVGGAGSLEIKPGVQLLDTPDFPAQWKGTAEGARGALQLLHEPADVDWTVLSPPPMIHPGVRSGRYRIGDDQVIMGKEGPADISVEDFAVAMVDEAESAIHRRQRFTVAN